MDPLEFMQIVEEIKQNPELIEVYGDTLIDAYLYIYYTYAIYYI